MLTARTIFAVWVLSWGELCDFTASVFATPLIVSVEKGDAEIEKEIRACLTPASGPGSLVISRSSIIDFSKCNATGRARCKLFEESQMHGSRS